MNKPTFEHIKRDSNGRIIRREFSEYPDPEPEPPQTGGGGDGCGWIILIVIFIFFLNGC